MNNQIDIIIVGTGAAGLYCALNLPADKKILMITKEEADKSDSFLAQGGICVLKNEDDYAHFFEDTLKAGHYENSREIVDIMIRSSRDIIRDLISIGVEFEKEKGEFLYTREGAHSQPRIMYHKDVTGMEITGKLLKEVRNRSNITIMEHTTMIDILSVDNLCTGVVVVDEHANVSSKQADYVVLATGGIGGLYEHTTNYAHLTGDSLAIALKHKIELKNINYIQIHPTTLYSEKPGRRFLISESVRGEGAVLLNQKHERFVDELLPRDLLTEAIRSEMKREDSNFVWISMMEMGKDAILKRFPNIYQKCLEEGYDITKECIPVTPAQHYFMGGIKVNSHSRTSMEHLYAVGETACNGVHGANRLASNSLLESLVFAKRAAGRIDKRYENVEVTSAQLKMDDYEDLSRLKEEYRKMVLKEIERVNHIQKRGNYEQSHHNETKCG